MDPRVAQVTSALAVIYNASATPQERREASRIVEAVKDLNPTAEAVRLAVALKEQVSADESVVMFSLHVLEHVVRVRWNSLGDEERSQFRGLVVDIISAPVGRLGAVSRRKAASLVVEVAKREWPQSWPGLMGALSALAAPGQHPDHRITAILVLRGIPEEVCIYRDRLMSELRKSDVIGGLGEACPSIVSFLVRTASETTSDSGEVCAQAIEALGAYVHWAPAGPVVEALGVPALLAQLQSSPILQIRQRAADVALALVQRGSYRGRAVDTVVDKLATFPLHPGIFEAFGQAAQASFQACPAYARAETGLAPPDQAAAYSHFVRVIEVLALSGCAALAFATAPTGSIALPDNFPLLVQFMVSLFDLPTVVASELVLPFLQTLTFKQSTAISDELMRHLLEACTVKISASVKRTPAGKTAATDLDDSFSSGKERMIALVRSLAQFKPDLTITFALEKASAWFRTLCSPGGPQAIEGTRKGIFGLVFASTFVFIRSKEWTPAPQTRELAVQFIRGLLQLESTEATRMHVLGILKRIMPMLTSGYFSDSVEPMFEKVLAIYADSLGHGEFDPVKHVRSKCLRLLTRLATACDLRSKTSALAAYYTDTVCGTFVPASVVTATAGSVAAGGLLASGFERAGFIEVLLAASQRDAGLQLTVANQVIGPIFSWWTSAEAVKRVGTMECVAGLAVAARERDDVVSVLSALEKCMKRIGRQGGGSFAVGILPNVLTLIQALHELWDPAAREARLTPEQRAAVEPLLSPRSARLCNTTREASKGVEHLRELSYSLLGMSIYGGALLSVLPSLAATDVASAIHAAAFATMGPWVIDDHVSEFLLAVVSPLSAPATRDTGASGAGTPASVVPVPVAVEALVTEFIRGVVDRLENSWATHSAAAAATISTVGGDEGMTTRGGSAPEGGENEEEDSEESQRVTAMFVLTNRFSRWLQQQFGSGGLFERSEGLMRFGCEVTARALSWPNERTFVPLISMLGKAAKRFASSEAALASILDAILTHASRSSYGGGNEGRGWPPEVLITLTKDVLAELQPSANLVASHVQALFASHSAGATADAVCAQGLLREIQETKDPRTKKQDLIQLLRTLNRLRRVDPQPTAMSLPDAAAAARSAIAIADQPISDSIQSVAARMRSLQGGADGPAPEELLNNLFATEGKQQ